MGHQMSQQAIEDRVSRVEQEQARQGAKLDHLSGVADRTASNVEKLLERDAKRPQALSWGGIAGTCGGLAAMAAVVWWLIGASPAIVELERRMSKLDDPDIGRVPRLEKEVGWNARVTKF